jgi:hypothetical protein
MLKDDFRQLSLVASNAEPDNCRNQADGFHIQSLSIFCRHSLKYGGEVSPQRDRYDELESITFFRERRRSGGQTEDSETIFELSAQRYVKRDSGTGSAAISGNRERHQKGVGDRGRAGRLFTFPFPNSCEILNSLSGGLSGKDGYFRF